MYKISVILPVFNAEDTLEDAFNSILNQTFDFEDIEVIFVDDCSKDNSKAIIEGYVNQYDNVKLISHKQNSGYAGKPRNTGVQHASADYIMFLDPDDHFYEDAFEFLYNKITENDVDMVSGTYNHEIDGEFISPDWDLYNLGYENHFTSLRQNIELLRLPASVFTKIFRRSFIIDNDLKFPEDIPSQDLIFVTRALIKARGFIFINHPIVEYTIWEGKSLTSKKDKKTLSGHLKAYTLFYDDIMDYDPDYGWMSLILVPYWMKRLVLSEASHDEKVDVLVSAKYLFDEFKKSKRAKPYKKYRELFDLIHREEYHEAVKLMDYLALTFPESKDKVTEIVKNKDIFILFGEFNLNIGGVGGTVINRASYLADNGYNVTLLNLETIRNYEFIRNHFHENGRLSEKVNFINMYEYYANKNTLNPEGNPNLETNVKNAGDYRIEKVLNEDNSITLNYYSDDDELIKNELYVDDCLIFEEIGFNRNFYTKDGFKYLSRVKRNNKSLYILYARDIAGPLEFKTLGRMVYYFVNEICVSNDKPFLVCDSTDHWYNFAGISKNHVYKIASMHGNPFLPDEAEQIINPKIKHFQILDELDGFVLLTDSVRKDLKKQLKFNKFYVIPNFIDNELLEYEPVEKDLNVIRIFSRIAPEKQLHEAIKAFKIVSQKNDDAVLEIYGRLFYHVEEMEHAELTALINELGLEDRVVFKGFLDDVSGMMKRSLCTLLTSKFEGLPLSLLESMTNSTPVICYDINYGPRDVITDGEDGILVEPYNVEELADSMLYLLDNPEIAIEMGRKAREKIRNEFSQESAGKKWEDLFADVYVKSTLEDYKRQLKMSDTYDDIVKENKDVKKENKKIIKENNKIKKENKQLKRFKKEILNSTSWKITKPIRKLKALLKKIKG